VPPTPAAAALVDAACANGRGSEPEKVLYAVADAEVLVKQYAVEACSLSKRGAVRVAILN
jgi:hypothetical protein